MNIGIFTGRLTADATFRNGSEPSKNNARFNIAITDPYNSEKTDFFTVSCFGKKADYVKNGMEKGRFLKGCEAEVSGTVHFENYKTQNGEQRYYVNVMAESIYCKVHKDFKAAQNGETSTAPMSQNNGAGSYNQNGIPQQYQGQSGQAAGGNQYGAPAYQGQGAPAQQFNRPAAQPGRAGQYTANPGYNQNGAPQQYQGQSRQAAGGNQYGAPAYQGQGTPAQQFNRPNPQAVTPPQYNTASAAYTGNMPQGNIPDSIPAPDYNQNEQEGGFRPATYQY